MEPFKYQDMHGQWLDIRSTDEGGAAKLGVSDRDGAAMCYVGVGQLHGVTSALHEACGKEPPLVLPRPRDFEGPRYRGEVFTGRLGSMVTVGLRGIEPEALDADTALEFAALIAANAEAARRAEPDPLDVEELATAIRSELHPDSERLGLRPSESDRTAARAALRWLENRERQASRG